MSLPDTIREYVRENSTGMLADFVFALVWVTIVSLIFELIDGPQWAYYLLMLSGVVAYYGFHASLAQARGRQ